MSVAEVAKTKDSTSLADHDTHSYRHEEDDEDESDAWMLPYSIEALDLKTRKYETMDNRDTTQSSKDAVFKPPKGLTGISVSADALDHIPSDVHQSRHSSSNIFDVAKVNVEIGIQADLHDNDNVSINSGDISTAASQDMSLFFSPLEGTNGAQSLNYDEEADEIRANKIKAMRRRNVEAAKQRKKETQKEEKLMKEILKNRQLQEEKDRQQALLNEALKYRIEMDKLQEARNAVGDDFEVNEWDVVADDYRKKRSSSASDSQNSLRTPEKKSSTWCDFSLLGLVFGMGSSRSTVPDYASRSDHSSRSSNSNTKANSPSTGGYRPSPLDDDYYEDLLNSASRAASPVVIPNKFSQQAHTSRSSSSAKRGQDQRSNGSTNSSHRSRKEHTGGLDQSPAYISPTKAAPITPIKKTGTGTGSHAKGAPPPPQSAGAAATVHSSSSSARIAAASPTKLLPALVGSPPHKSTTTSTPLPTSSKSRQLFLFPSMGSTSSSPKPLSSNAGKQATAGLQASNSPPAQTPGADNASLRSDQDGFSDTSSTTSSVRKAPSFISRMSSRVGLTSKQSPSSNKGEPSPVAPPSPPSRHSSSSAATDHSRHSGPAAGTTTKRGSFFGLVGQGSQNAGAAKEQSGTFNEKNNISSTSSTSSRASISSSTSRHKPEGSANGPGTGSPSRTSSVDTGTTTPSKPKSSSSFGLSFGFGSSSPRQAASPPATQARVLTNGVSQQQQQHKPSASAPSTQGSAEPNQVPYAPRNNSERLSGNGVTLMGSKSSQAASAQHSKPSSKTTPSHSKSRWLF